MSETTGCNTLMHCWHVKSSTTDGLGKSGYDNVFCCFCGKAAIKRWKYVRDLKHGSYADLLVRSESDIEVPHE